MKTQEKLTEVKCKLLSNEVEEIGKVMGIEEADKEDEEMEGSGDKEEEEEWQDVAGGEASPVTPEASESEEEDPDLTPG